jgi:hypothetical protein
MSHRLSNGFKTGPELPQTSRVSVSPEQPIPAEPEPETSVERAARMFAAHPAIAIGTAFVMGMLIGKWAKRS